MNTIGENLHFALIHYPVRDKNGETVASAVTNLDIHDIARAAKTYGIGRFFIVTPVADQQKLVNRIIEHWTTGYGGSYNPARKQALETIRLMDSMADVKDAVTRSAGSEPVMTATSARPPEVTLDFKTLRRRLANGRPHVILLGTAWGLGPEILESADEILARISGGTAYNHLSVRCAAAVIMDRLLGE